MMEALGPGVRDIWQRGATRSWRFQSVSNDGEHNFPENIALKQHYDGLRPFIRLDCESRASSSALKVQSVGRQNVGVPGYG